MVDNVNDFIDDKIIGEEGKTTTITESTILDSFEISELQTNEYIYNAIVEVYSDDGATLMYYVAYEGTVIAGINFDDIAINVNDETKEITISIPEVSVQETIVDAGTLEYIFTKSKYNTQDVWGNAYSICMADLREKAAANEKFLEMAKENTRQVIDAMVSPWVEQVDSEYTVIIQ